MIDFRIKSASEKSGGLNVGLSAGPYCRKVSLLEAVYVTEDAFAILEPSIVRYCPRYRHFGHWGVTNIGKDEWLAILGDWSSAERQLSQESTVDVLTGTLLLPEEIARNIAASFGSSCEPLRQMLQALNAWLRSVLLRFDEVCILGI